MPHLPTHLPERLPLLLIGGALQFVACEFLVAGSWRGDYSYSQNLISDLGVPYCGPTGNAPCSSSFVLINVSFVVVGITLLVAAAWMGRRDAADTVVTVFLAAAGFGAIVVGLISSTTNWPVHSLGVSLFLIFGSCSALGVGLSPARPARRGPSQLTAALGFLGCVGYFAYAGNWPMGLGPGGIERLSAYSVLLGFVISVLLIAARRPGGPSPRPHGHEPSTSSVVSHRRDARRGPAAIALFTTVLLVTSGWLLVTSGCGFPTVRASPTDVVMFDDFNGPAGAPPNPRYWSHDVGAGGWGNNEIQTYTGDPENARIDGQGHLVIDAVRRPDGSFSSARLTTRAAFAFSAGRAEARLKVPSGDGVHPAFWLLGTDVDQVGWPRSGEIDVMETVNAADSYTCALHGPNETGGPWQASRNAPAPTALSEGFHTYWVQRSPGSITMGIDDLVTCTFTPKNIGPRNIWVFDKPFYLLLNVAIGGDYPGPPSSETPSPATMLVDWVRTTAS